MANCALLVLSHVRQYIDTIIREPKVYSVASNKLFDIVKEGCRSVLMPAKLFFFESVVSQFNRFLVRYQTDRRMVPSTVGIWMDCSGQSVKGL